VVTIEKMKTALLNRDREPKEYEELCSRVGIYNFGRKATYDSDSFKRFMDSNSIADLQRWDRMEYDADAFFNRLCDSDCFDAWGRVK
jgi:hypothetical protein